jgi:hypothetical protein
MGGEPLDRSGGMNKVDSIAAILAEEKFSSCRGSGRNSPIKVNHIFKTRFYVAFNFGKKLISLRSYR